MDTDIDVAMQEWMFTEEEDAWLTNHLEQICEQFSKSGYGSPIMSIMPEKKLCN